MLLVLTLLLPAVPAWPCDAKQGSNTALNSNATGEHASAHHTESSGSHHEHSQPSLAELPPLQAGDGADHDCCPEHDPASSCSTTPGCGQGTGASLLTVSANPVSLPVLKDQELDRLTTALPPSHSLPPFRPPSN